MAHAIWHFDSSFVLVSVVLNFYLTFNAIAGIFCACFGNLLHSIWDMDCGQCISARTHRTRVLGICREAESAAGVNVDAYSELAIKFSSSLNVHFLNNREVCVDAK